MKEQSPAPAEPGEGTARSASVAVPGIIADFLDRATVGVAGTRDHNLVPHLHRISGWRIEPDRHAMTCLIPESFSKHLLGSLEDNGRFALTIEEIGPHETYQFKGCYRSSRPCNEEDLACFRQLQDRFARVVATKFGMPESVAGAFVVEPRIAVTFEVEEIYLQTPGPGAGQRLAPPEEK